MPNNTLRRFDDDAISNIFSVLKANLGKKTDAIKLSYDPNPVNEYSYFVVNTTGGATATNTINAEKIADTLNDLYALVKVNGALTLSNNAYSGTGNAVAASDLATIFNSLLTAIGNKQDTLTFDNVPTNGSDNPVKSDGIFDKLAEKFDLNKIDNSALDATGATAAIGYIETMLDDEEAAADRSAAATALDTMLTNDEDSTSQYYGKAFIDVSTGKTGYLPDVEQLAAAYNMMGNVITKIGLFLYGAITYVESTETTPTPDSGNLITSGGVYTALSGKVDTSRITTSITSGSTDIPTSGAVASAIAGLSGITFYKCTSGQYSGNSQTFDGDDGTTTSGTVTGTTVYSFTLTEAPKKINFISLNGQQIQYTYSGSSTHIISITLPSSPALTSTDIIIVDYIPYPIIATPETNKIYLVPNDGTGTSNIYNEYIYIDSAWELIGSTESDFSQYVKYEDLEVITVEELTSLFTAATAANVQSGS